MKLNKATEKFLLDCKVRTSKETYEYELSKCRMLNLFIGDYNTKRIDRDIINEYIVAHREYNPKISNTSLNKGVATLKRVVKYADNRTIEYKKLKEGRKLTPTIPINTKKIIFDYLESQKHRSRGFRNLLFFRLLDDTGLRLKEIRHLRIRNLDISNNSFVATTTKTDTDRIVYYSDYVKDLIIEYIETFDITDYLFINFKTSEIITTNSVENVAKRIKQKLKIPFSISPHKWRHTFANEFSKNVNDLESLRIILGHTKITTTQRYLHHDNDYIKAQYMKSNDRRIR